MAMDQLVSISRNYPDFEIIHTEDVVNVCSMEEFSDFLIKAEELDGEGELSPPIFNSDLGLNAAEVADSFKSSNSMG